MWEDLEWEEVSMVKALKMWDSNNRNIKCVCDNHTYYYNGWSEIKIQHNCIKNGKWFIEKM